MFDYQPHTPPRPKPPGAAPKPSIHADIVGKNYADGPDAWTQFTIGPRGSNPGDPYDANIGEHTRDLARGARQQGHRINYRVYNAVTGEHVPTAVRNAEGVTVTADAVLTEVGVPAVIAFNVQPKRA